MGYFRQKVPAVTPHFTLHFFLCDKEPYVLGIFSFNILRLFFLFGLEFVEDCIVFVFELLDVNFFLPGLVLFFLNVWLGLSHIELFDFLRRILGANMGWRGSYPDCAAHARLDREVANFFHSEVLSLVFCVELEHSHAIDKLLASDLVRYHLLRAEINLEVCVLVVNDLTGEGHRAFGA